MNKIIGSKALIAIVAVVMIATISMSSVSSYAWIWWTPDFSQETLEVTANGVNFRRDPVNGVIIGLLYKGERLQNDINADHATYFHLLRSGNTKGWSHKDYFKKV
ncbi:MAG: hypothetical protein LBI54_04685 [Lachnospiraceae bacterium]|jgi:hypothetical protein|nr:hypothetical protein [Lachnospiraceae bacterium]